MDVVFLVGEQISICMASDRGFAQLSFEAYLLGFLFIVLLLGTILSAPVEKVQKSH